MNFKTFFKLIQFFALITNNSKFLSRNDMFRSYRCFVKLIVNAGVGIMIFSINLPNMVLQNKLEFILNLRLLEAYSSFSQKRSTMRRYHAFYEQSERLSITSAISMIGYIFFFFMLVGRYLILVNIFVIIQS